jgi:TPR repeat protein
MENIELYIIVILIIAIIWFILNTVKFYQGEKKKVKNLHRFAKEGEVAAQNRLAKRYQKGDMVTKDCQKAAFWYQKASFLGDEDAKGHLAAFLDKGRKTIKKKKC